MDRSVVEQVFVDILCPFYHNNKAKSLEFIRSGNKNDPIFNQLNKNDLLRISSEISNVFPSVKNCKKSHKKSDIAIHIFDTIQEMLESSINIESSSRKATEEKLSFPGKSTTQSWESIFRSPLSSPVPSSCEKASSPSILMSKAGSLVPPSLINHPRKIKVFLSLINIEGVTSKEILQAMRNFEDMEDALDEEIVLATIFSLRDAKETLLAKELEDRTYDRVLLESEGERQNIENRKRQRISQVEEDMNESLLDIDMFDQSVLLGRNTSFHHSTLGEKGCLLLIDLALYISLASDNSFRDLRKLFVQILLLERDSVRYYSEDSYPYFDYILVHIWEFFHQSLSLLFPGLNLHNSGLYYLDSFSLKSWKATRSQFISWNQLNIDYFCHNYLTKLKHRVAYDLFRLPEVGATIPLAFRHANHAFGLLNNNNQNISSKKSCNENDNSVDRTVAIKTRKEEDDDDEIVLVVNDQTKSPLQRFPDTFAIELVFDSWSADENETED